MWDFTVPLESRRPWPTRTLTPFVNRISGLQPIVAVHASADGTYFVACQDGDAPALITAGGKQLGTCAMGERGFVDVVQCKGHRAPVTCSAPHAVDGGAFYTAGQDGTARLWQAASYERRSVYAVKHGSGQLNDTVVVESVLGLSAAMGGGGALFASGGADGLVQIWDARAKYRPGGAAASWRVHGLAYSEAQVGAGAAAKKSAAMHFAAFDTHVGGMAEVRGGGAPLLAVRVGAELQCLDLRAPLVKGGRLALPPVADLGGVLDTTPVRACAPASLYTCTDRAGYHHVVGGHVVQYDAAGSALSCTSAWRAGHPDEDALCVAVDAATEDVFCGLSSGAVVVNVGSPSASHFMRWLDTRPVSEAVVRKRTREEAADDAAEVDGVDALF
ncbi:hypothetical protein STCU_06615 [Strigomonas culicis]|uniref:Guanine nucleotide-binding protein subunit beta-like protein n=1 Tax=Strigomonas culicis TaxID=28005 RepID=S9U9P4_9TRYP|nr:hypothetical protein STCU_06615 [Strigomonas culicis]|eukprot:EPY25628.1 hypothetical protein STCU_06615 [Strigomonas culicis]